MGQLPASPVNVAASQVGGVSTTVAVSPPTNPL